MGYSCLLLAAHWLSIVIYCHHQEKFNNSPLTDMVPFLHVRGSTSWMMMPAYALIRLIDLIELFCKQEWSDLLSACM
jgi:hypothetical protein